MRVRSGKCRNILSSRSFMLKASHLAKSSSLSKCDSRCMLMIALWVQHCVWKFGVGAHFFLELYCFVFEIQTKKVRVKKVKDESLEIFNETRLGHLPSFCDNKHLKFNVVKVYHGLYDSTFIMHFIIQRVTPILSCYHVTPRYRVSGPMTRQIRAVSGSTPAQLYVELNCHNENKCCLFSW